MASTSCLLESEDEVAECENSGATAGSEGDPARGEVGVTAPGAGAAGTGCGPHPGEGGAPVPVALPATVTAG